MKVRTMQINGKTWMLEDDMRRLLKPMGLALEPKAPEVAKPAKPKAAPKKRRTKAELQAEARKLEGQPLEDVARKLRISVETVKKLALVTKE
jgi:hypothetical protein